MQSTDLKHFFFLLSQAQSTRPSSSKCFFLLLVKLVQTQYPTKISPCIFQGNMTLRDLFLLEFLSSNQFCQGATYISWSLHEKIKSWSTASAWWVDTQTSWTDNDSSKVKQFKQENSDILTDRRIDGRTDRRTDGRYQVHYLPASRSIKKLFPHQYLPICALTRVVS